MIRISIYITYKPDKILKMKQKFRLKETEDGEEREKEENREKSKKETNRGSGRGSFLYETDAI